MGIEFGCDVTNRHSNGGNQVEKTAHVESIKSVAQFPEILPSFTG
jgi:hypothetical protein